MVDSGADVPVASPVASPPPAPAAAASTPVVPATNGASTTHSTSQSNGSTPAPPTPAGEALAEPSSTVVAPSAEPGATTTGAREATPASSTSTSASATAPRTPAAAGAAAAPGTASAPAPRSVSTPAPPRKRGRPPKNAQAQSNNPTPAGTPAAAATVGDSKSFLNGQVSSVSVAPLVPPPPPKDPLEDVTLTDEERRKMLVVLHSLDPSHILSQPITSPDAPPITLSELLSNASSTIPHLRTNLNTACTTSLVLSFTTEPPLQCAIESFRSTALGMLTELGRLHLRKRSSTTAPNEGLKTAMTLPRPTKKYMLHRSLVGGVDLFSSTTVLSDEEVQSLSTLHALTFPSSTTSAPAPTLGHLNPRPYVQTRPPRPLPRSKPSQMLYYDPFQSFAPNYDSSGATLDYQRSVAYVDSRTRVYEWERDLVEARDGGEVGSEEGLKALQGLAGKELELINEVLRTEEWKKVVEMQAEAVQEEEVEAGDVDARLKRNKALLEKLIKAQLARTLLPPPPPPPPKMGPHESGLLAGEAENQTADKLISSLSTILQSIAPSNSATERRRVFPPVDRVRAATPRIMQRLAKDECSFGNLDPYNWRALKESTLVSPPKVEQ
ncbi:BZ3500_MvSof-1268-A1-R1_Chr5-2g07864 [Microbotryum saponariae]|uniref:BZ3500_MvSof-1268-A1-R1_Chr5-2g07864 protein n=1 Tax=Microbotryum saponariae TaxID=289078 RepID=A0A2X0M1H4_9BASI|nr:BZ3500_MvSof-1268-A1-R1_Chr5-2g07864 [Microbotryum saponariae]SDA05733.1 BZ3501_MvSof-1269-A2-R1_Chr5-2g07686 [Microbotryum saponariae]